MEKNISIISTNYAKTLVWKHEYGVKLWCHKDRTPNANDHPMPLNDPPRKFSAHATVRFSDLNLHKRVQKVMSFTFWKFWFLGRIDPKTPGNWATTSERLHSSFRSTRVIQNNKLWWTARESQRLCELSRHLLHQEELETNVQVAKRANANRKRFACSLRACSSKCLCGMVTHAVNLAWLGSSNRTPAFVVGRKWLQGLKNVFLCVQELHNLANVQRFFGCCIV